MKKYFLLFASVALSTLIFAQTKPSFGIRGGVSYAGLQGDAVSSVQNLVDFSNGAITTSSRPGLFAGGFVNIPVGAGFSIEPAVYYAQKSYEMKGDFAIKGAEFLSAGAKARLNTSYIDVPLMAKMNVGGLQIFAGPQVSFLADAKLRMTAGALGFNIVDNTVDAKDQFNNLDFGASGGLGYQFSNGVNITAAYDHGLSKVDKGQNLDSYNRAFKLGVGFKF